MRPFSLLALLALLVPMTFASAADRPVPPGLLEALQDKEPAAQIKAIKALSKLGIEAVAPLVKALADPEGQVSNAAAYGLRLLRVEPAALADALKPHTTDADPAVRKGVAGALARCGSFGVPLLLAALKDDAVAVRRQAALSLQPVVVKSPVVAQEVVPALRKALADRSPAVRLEVVRTLGRCGPMAVPVLVEGLNDADAKVRAYASAGLISAKAEAKDVLPALTNVLRKDKVLSVRQSAVRTLGALGVAAVKPLTEALKDDEPALQFAALQALGQLGPAGKESIPTLTRLAAQATYPAVRSGVVGALAKMGPEAEPAILGLLERDDSDLRLACLKFLGRKGKAPRSVVPALVKALADKDPDVRALAAHVLGLIGPDAKEALPALQTALADKEKGVASVAEKAIQKIKE